MFVSGLAEVTDIFENEEINHAIEKVLKEVDIDYLAQTDYGETFRQFRDKHMDALNKTTLIIIGDARSNYFHPEDRILEEMREKCRRLIWLNPEPELVEHRRQRNVRLQTSLPRAQGVQEPQPARGFRGRADPVSERPG